MVAQILDDHKRRLDDNLIWLSKHNGGIQLLEYFYQTVRRFAEGESALRWKQAGKKVVGLLCNLVPEELVYAAGAVPVRLCFSLGGAVMAAEEICPSSLCPLVKSSLGMAMKEAALFRLCDVLVIPATCDGKKKLSEWLATEHATWLMDPPHTRDTALARKQWLTQLTMLKGHLEDLTGRRITAKGLREAISVCNHKRALARKLYHLASQRRIWGRDVLLVNSASFFDDPYEWNKQTEELCDYLHGHTPLEGDKARPGLLLTGSPVIPAAWKLPRLLEETGGLLVADELCSGGKALWEPAHVHTTHMEGLLSAISERSLMMACAYFTPNTTRINRLLQMILELNIDGVVYHVLTGCHLYGMEFWRVQEALGRAHVPVLKIETDLGDEDAERLRTRLETFVEVLNTGLQAGRERGF